MEWLLLQPCCVEMGGILFVMYGSSLFSGVFAITERSYMGLYDVIIFMFCFLLPLGLLMLLRTNHEAKKILYREYMIKKI